MEKENDKRGCKTCKNPSESLSTGMSGKGFNMKQTPDVVNLPAAKHHRANAQYTTPTTEVQDRFVLNISISGLYSM